MAHCFELLSREWFAREIPYVQQNADASTDRAFTCYTPRVKLIWVRAQQLCYTPGAHSIYHQLHYTTPHHCDNYTRATSQTNTHEAPHIEQHESFTVSASPRRRHPFLELSRRARDQIEQKKTRTRIKRSEHGTQQREGRQGGLHWQHPIRSVHPGCATMRQQLTIQ